MGFTLAEVLITLGVIGVVASLILPSVIENYQKRQSIVGLKKGYNTFLNAFQQAELEFESPKYWPELQKASSECSGYNGYKCTEPFVKKYFSSLNVIGYKKRKLRTQIKSLSGNVPSIPNAAKWYYLVDGSCFFILLNYDKYFDYIYYDVNGDKNPNILGKDIFIFDFGSVHDYKLEFESGFTRINNLSSSNVVKYLTKTSRTACSKTPASFDVYNSYSCGALIQYQGWKITDDYPW